MTTLIRRTLLISSTAIIALAVLPAIGAMAPVSLSGWAAQQAQASDDDDGSDDSGSDDSGSGGNGSGGSGGGSSHGGDDDGPDHDSDDDNGGDRDDDDSDDDDSADDSDDDDDSADDNGKSRGRGGDRDEIRLIVNDNQLQGLLSGSMIPVDQNGKRLRFEVEQEHGNTEIKLRAPKGTLTGVTVIPAP